MNEFFKHGHHSYPPSISEYGTLRKTIKSNFLDCLQDYGSSTLTTPEFTAKVVGGAIAVQSLKPRISKTFTQYASTEFYNSVLNFITLRTKNDELQLEFFFLKLQGTMTCILIKEVFIFGN